MCELGKAALSTDGPIINSLHLRHLGGHSSLDYPILILST